jgi:hypothetical protein
MRCRTAHKAGFWTWQCAGAAIIGLLAIFASPSTFAGPALNLQPFLNQMSCSSGLKGNAAMQHGDCTKRAQCRRAIASELTSVGLDASFSLQHICRESALDLLVLRRHPDG